MDYRAIKIFEKIGDKKIEIAYTPMEALQSQKDSATDPMQKSFSGLMLCVANGDPIEMSETLVKFPIKLKTVSEYATEILKK